MKMHNRGKAFLSAMICLAVGVCFLFVYRAVNLKWHVDRDGYYEISTPEEYRNFWKRAAWDTAIKGRLTKDITLNELSDYENWKEEPPEHPSLAVECFTGVFDGNGHTVYGLYSENGYGLVKENSGEIKNLSIKNSLITGGYSNSGICYANYRKIINCRFEGALLVDKEDEPGRLAGVCIINYGFIEKCGYNGVMITIGYLGNSYSGDMAGICTENRCSIEGCYNLTKNRNPYYSSSYAISDMGMENCYVRADGGWDISAGNHIIKLEEEQLYAIPGLIKGDLSLWAEGPSDQIVSRLIRRLAEQGVVDLAEIEIQDLTGKNEQQGFHVRLSFRKSMIEVQSYPGKEVTRDYDSLMKICSECLQEVEAGDWLHQTYRLTRFFERKDGTYHLTLEELEAFQEPEMLVLYQTKEEGGFFYAVGGTLYRIISSSSRLQEQVLAGLSADRKAGDNISWEDERVRQAVYRQLIEEGKGTNIFYGKEEENPVFCREEVMALTRLTITGAGSVESFDDLVYMPELTELYLNGFDEVSKETRTELHFNPKESLPKLKSLTIEGARIRDHRVVWEALTGLESLTLIQCWFQNTDELRDLNKLRSLHIDTDTVEDTSFLRDMPLLTELSLDCCEINRLDDIIKCKSLQKLSLSFNDIEDISDLAVLNRLEELNLRANRIEDIEVLASLKKLQVIDLSLNEISDFSPLWEKRGLESLYLIGNKAQNWGDLIYLPDVAVGCRYSEEKEETARQAIEQFHPNEDIYIEDAATGDFNQDGIEDLAVVGFQAAVRFGEDTFFGGERRAYLFMGTEKGFEEIQTIYLTAPTELNEDNWSSLKDGLLCTTVLSGNHLVIQTYSSGNVQGVNAGGCFRITEIYTWDKDRMKPECRNETEYDNADS